MFRRLDHVALAVRDLKLSIEFYHHHFGFQPYHEQQIEGRLDIIYLQLGDTVLELFYNPSMEPNHQNSGFHLCLYSDDFARDVAFLKERGIQLQREPHPTSARRAEEIGWQRATCLGPDGEEIEIRG